MGLLKLLLLSVVNGVTAQAELNTRRAADGRHPPFITAFELPASHIALPEGTIMVKGVNPGEAKPATATSTTDPQTSVVTVVPPDPSTFIGVLDVRVAENEESGNVILHGSCPADILKYIDGDGELVDANADQIVALRGINIYV